MGKGSLIRMGSLIKEQFNWDGASQLGRGLLIREGSLIREGP